MFISGNYAGCTVFVNGNNGEKTCCATIKSHNKDEKTITINGSFPNIHKDDVVTLIIMANSGIHEYSGKMRKSITDSSYSKIGLFGGKAKKDGRVSKRYTINKRATVDRLVINKQPFAFLHPLEVKVVNLSASGVLIETKPNSFNLDAIFELVIDIGKEPTRLLGQVVRVKNTDTNSAEYGCRFIKIGE